MSPRTMAGTLRALADFLDAHPDLPRPPYVSVYDHRPDEAYVKWYLHINGNAVDEADQKAKANQIVRTIGGKWEKDFSDDARFTQTRDGLNLQVTVTREAVCERIVVGTEKVTIPATEALAAQPERVEEREVVEWRCTPLLADEQVSA